MAGANHGVPEQWENGKDVVWRARDKCDNLLPMGTRDMSVRLAGRKTGKFQ